MHPFDLGRVITRINWFYVLLLAVIITIGVFTIYAAGNNPAWESYPLGLQDAWRKQKTWITLGAVLFVASSLLDFRIWAIFSPILYVMGLLLLIIVLFAGIDVHGTRGWLNIAGLVFQPSQAAICASILFCSTMLSRLPQSKWQLMREPWMHFWLVGLVMGVPFLLVLKGGDVGSALVWIPVTIALLLAARIPFRYLITLFLIVVALLPPAYYFGLSATKRSRIDVWLDMLHGRPVDILDDAWAPWHVRLAISSAGWDGRGYLSEKSIHALGRIPKKTVHTDYIFAVFAEEHGFLGSAILMSLYSMLFVMCLFFAIRCRHLMGRLVCTGGLALLFAHVFQNVGMCIGLAPITGIPLPMMSYGGTFLLIVLFLCGVMHSVWIYGQDTRQLDFQPREV